jgi:hypothetical protein
MTAGALARAVLRGRSAPASAEERCDLCGLAIAEPHRHLLDTAAQELLCACAACAVLFDRGDADDARYRLVPQHRRALAGLDPRLLGVPVGLAFFTVRRDGAVFAHYPSPAGATRWEVEGRAWRRFIASEPALASMQPEVEALLVRAAGGAAQAWVVPVDDCFRLAGLVRERWQGLMGGDAVRQGVERFFEELCHGSDTRR